MSDDNGPLSRFLRIARWEVETSGGTIDRRTAVAFAVALLLLAAAAPVLLGGGVALDDGIYRVAVDEDHEYHPAVAEHDTLRGVSDRENADLVVTDGAVQTVDSPKGNAALAELDEAIRAYNNRQLEQESDQAAAFPVVVELTEQSRETGTAQPTLPGEGGDDSLVDTADDGIPTEDEETAPPDDEPPADETDGDPPDDGDEPTADADQPSDGETLDEHQTDEEEVDDSDQQDDETVADSTADDGGIGGLFGGSQTGTPAQIEPPFPFEPLILAFLFIIPMNFVIQAYGSTIINERLNRRGELLLVTPASPAEIVAGKTAPYLAALLAITGAIAVAVHQEVAGLLSMLAVLPLALLFLASTFVGAMFARSYKELTFVTVTISVFLTTYAFVPAIFTDVTPIALISPLTLVVRDLQGVGVSVAEYAFSTGPVYLSSAVLFALGLGVYREEDMFTQRPVHLKALDALAAHIHRPIHVAAVAAILIPFVFVIQLLSVAVLYPLPLEVGFIVVLVLAAAVEEVVKSIHVFASYEHGRFERTVPVALMLGAFAGVGFFVAEKIVHAGQLVGLGTIDLGQAVFQLPVGVSTPVAVALFFLPLLLHVVTAAISALGARKSTRAYLLALGTAIVVHVAYNLGVLSYAFL